MYSTVYGLQLLVSPDSSYTIVLASPKTPQNIAEAPENDD